jgi:hypothetical protein
MGNVQNGAVLDIGSTANANTVHIGSNCALRPDADIVAHNEVTQYHGGWVDHDPIAQFGCVSLV